MDHRKLIKQYDLGHIEEHSAGLIHFHPQGQKVFKKLRHYIADIHEQQGYQEVSSPVLLHKDMWVKSGHWEKYQELMFVEASEDMAIKPMSCPGHINIFQHKRRSYRELPYRLFEFGHVHRKEPSGALSGWMRLRGFVQDDSHVFCFKEHIEDVVSSFVKMCEKVYKDFGFVSWQWQLSLRPQKRSGSDELWDQAEGALRGACHGLGIQACEKEGDGAFYGPKLEVILKDHLGRNWQCGVAQLDFVLPQRFDLSAQDKNGKRQDVVMVHHAVLGSLERFVSILLEERGCLPHWLAPQQVAVCPISEGQYSYAQSVCDILKGRGFSCQVEKEGSLSSRLKALDDKMVPFRVVVGQKEMDEGKVSLRMFHEASVVMGLGPCILKLQKELSVPF